jgi:hypothetical protein|tara:strand:- start:3833 stop:4078 length:246 start_codon:yes stop_codon:yes gene_type:complete
MKETVKKDIYTIIDSHKSKRTWKNCFKRTFLWDAEELYYSLCKRQFDLSNYSQCKGYVELRKNGKIIKYLSFDSNIKKNSL